MAHGAPDFSDIQKGEAIYRIDDMGELAVRLGSFVTYDRRGDVIWMEDFTLGLDDYAVEEAGTLSTYALSSKYYHTPPFSLELVHSAITGNYIAYVKRVARPGGNRVGFATTFLHEGNASQLYLNIYYYDGETLRYSYAIFDQYTKELSLRTLEDGTLLLASDLPVLNYLTLFSHLKLVVDLSDYSIVRVSLNDADHTPTDRHMASSASASARHITFKVSAFCNNSLTGKYYLDNIIATTNEP